MAAFGIVGDKAEQPEVGREVDRQLSPKAA
jgi:hypothetical protein